MGLGEGVEPSSGRVGQGERGRAEPPADADLVPDRVQPLGSDRAVDGERDHEVRQPVLGADLDRSAVELGRPVACRRERLRPDRIVDDADGRGAIDDQTDGHAEQGDPVGIVDRPVERIDDPDPAVVRRGETRLLGQDPVAGEGGADGLDDERLGQVVDLGHDVLRALVADRLDPAEPVAEQLPCPDGEVGGEGELDAPTHRRRRGSGLGPERIARRGIAGGHGPVHSTASGRTVLPRTVISFENETVPPGSIRGLTMNAASGPSPVEPAS